MHVLHLITNTPSKHYLPTRRHAWCTISPSCLEAKLPYSKHLLDKENQPAIQGKRFSTVPTTGAQAHNNTQIALCSAVLVMPPSASSTTFFVSILLLFNFCDPFNQRTIVCCLHTRSTSQSVNDNVDRYLAGSIGHSALSPR